MLRAVIFDFDGVITDSELLHLKAFNAVLGQFDIEISEESYYSSCLGFTDYSCFEFVAEQNGLELNNDKLKDLIRQKCEVFAELVKTGGGIIEGVRTFLEMLRENNIRMGIYSGAAFCDIELILDQAGLRSFFETIVSSDDVNNGKPDPEGFVLALQRINEAGREEPVSAGDCVVIEDSRWGLEAAKAAGMHTVAVTNSYAAEELSTAEKVVGGLGELSIGDLGELCR